MKSLSVFLLGFLLAAAGPAEIQPGSEPEPETELEAEAEVVNLIFAWPPGLEASVTTTQTRDRTVGDTPTKSSMTLRYSFQTASEGETLRLDFADASLEISSDSEPAMKSLQTEMTARIAELMPSYSVTKAGEFVGIHDLAAFQRNLRETLASAFEEFDPEAVQQAMQVVDAMTTEAVLASKAAEEWNVIVGAWAGGELEVGAEYVFSSKEPVAMFPGEEILMNYTFSANGFAPCRRGGEELRCVELEMRSTADPEDTGRMIEGFLSKFAGEALQATPVFTSLEVENVISVLTEPATLVPHSSLTTKTIRGTLSIGGEEDHIEQVETREDRYAYP